MDDAPAYQKHFADYAVIGELAGPIAWPYPADGCATYLSDLVLPRQGKDRWYWGLFLKTNPGEMIGGIELWRPGTPENRGFWLGRAFWGQGLMTEAATAVNDCAFDQLGFEKLVFENAIGNNRSGRVKEKTGARLVGTQPKKYVNPAYTESQIWELTKVEWEKFRADHPVPETAASPTVSASSVSPASHDPTMTHHPG